MMSTQLMTEQLMNYLDEVAEPDMVRQIEQSRYYQRKVRELDRAQQRFTARLFGHACPSAMELGEYHLGTLAERQASTIRWHLLQCLACYEQVAELRVYLAEGIAPLQDPMPLPLAQIVYPRLPSSRAALRVAVRSLDVRAAEENTTLTYELSEESEITIEIQDSETKPGFKRLMGLAFSPDIEEVCSAELKPIDNALPIAVSEVEFGMFSFENVPPNEYDLLLHGAERAILLRQLKV